jgi:(S)-mandelate dehydrogenase
MRPGGGPDFPAERATAFAQLGTSPRRYLYRGRNPKRAATIEDLRAMAHRRLPRFALEYLEAGAGDEGALAGNLSAFYRWRFLPRALVDVRERDLTRQLFDKRLPLPLLVAPTGLNGVFRKDADRLLAAGAAKTGIPFVQSTMSNNSIEEVAATPNLQHWFQLYVIDPPEITDDLIARAEAAGCEALVVTTDAQTFGKRSWDIRERVRPSVLTARTVFDAALHIRWWSSTLLPRGLPRFANLERWFPPDKRGLFESAFWTRDHMDVGLDWDRLARIRERWPRKLLVKGLLAPQDVERARTEGTDGAILSNHGGRQLDWAAAPLDMLPEARTAVGDRFPLLIDGGIRSGGDIVKALALGADAVLAGRPTLYGVAAAGEAGVVRAIRILRDEADLTLALLGCPRMETLDRRYLVQESN